MSDDKQMSGMMVCDTHNRRDCPVCWPHDLRPASPTPEQPAQDGGNRCKHGIRAPWECKDCLYGEPSGSALAPPAQTQQCENPYHQKGDHDSRTCYTTRPIAGARCKICKSEWSVWRSPSNPCCASLGNREPVPLNPDKQPSPSAAPAQEPESSRALRAAYVLPLDAYELVNLLWLILSTQASHCNGDWHCQIRWQLELAAGFSLTEATPYPTTLQQELDRVVARVGQSPNEPTVRATAPPSIAQPASPEGALREALCFESDLTTETGRCLRNRPCNVHEKP